MGRHVIIEKFWAEWYDGDKTLATENLGWADNVRRDAQSDSPELIFQYVVETIGLNILFYWVKDRNFYTIETERMPIEVRRIDGNPAWDGETEFLKASGGGRRPFHLFPRPGHLHIYIFITKTHNMSTSFCVNGTHLLSAIH